MDADNVRISTALMRPRLTFPLLLLLLVFIFSTRSFSQDLDKRISLKVIDKPVNEVLQEISRLGSVDFSFNPQVLPANMRVTIHARKRRIREILSEIFLPHGIDYFTVENHIVLKQRVAPGEEKTAGVALHPSRFTLSGFLRDKTSGEALIGANIYIRGTTTGAMTNGYGFYSLTLPGGTYPVVFSYMGYKEIIRDVAMKENTRMSVELEEDKLEIREVEIVAADHEAETRNHQMSELRFSQKTLAQLPGFGGDLDVIRALQAVPGIQTFGDGSSFYFVRGGNSDQNLMLIDEVPVYNPSHLFGFFSAFAPDAINEVEIYKGDFPAKFGGRLSSVIDIKAREGNMKRFGFSGNIGPFASNLSVEGPIVKDRGSFCISGRLSTLNWMNSISALNKTFDFQFFDVNAKLNYRQNDNNRFFFTFYTGEDDFNRQLTTETNYFGMNWNNLAGTFRWNHLFSSRIFSNTTLNYSRYNYALTLPQEQNGYWNSSISNITFKTDFTWYLNPRNTIRSGLEVTLHHANPGNVSQTATNAAKDAPVVAQYHAMEYVFYISNEQVVSRKVSVRYGIRLPVWQDIGPTRVSYFDVNHHLIDAISYGNNIAYSTAFSPEPRLSIQYQVNQETGLKASYSRSTQFLQLLSNSTSPFTSLEVWAPCGPNISPQTSDQVAVGFFHDLAGAEYTVSAETYYKWFRDHLDYADHANMLFNPLIEGELRFGKAWSYGLELMLRKKTGNFTGWIGYTWSRAFIQTPGVNEGMTYRANYDRPNDICVNLCYDTKKRWTFTANWIYLTGGAITTPVGFYYFNGYSVPLYGEKNNDRLPDYHRLDLSVTYAFNKPGSRFRHSLALTIYNAYGRLNPFAINFNKMLNDNGDFVVPSNQNGQSTLLPTSVSVAGIIPSLNYQFKF
ncbi:MAG: TonB-dependent receptor [Bacteroidota bacterium]